MAFLTHVPSPRLAGFVQSFWHCDGAPQLHARERVLPTGDVQLVIGLCNDPLRVFEAYDGKQSRSYGGPLVCGPHSRPVIIDTRPLAACMGVVFKPGRAIPFLGAPASELHNLNLPLEDLWGEGADELHDRLRTANTPSARFQILEQALCTRLLQAPAWHPAVAYAITEFQTVPHEKTIGRVAECTGFTPRWFIELFRTQVGMPPKLYCRLQRFQKALAIAAQQQRPGWGILAATCGYFDQAHLIRDFRAFSGISPTEYVRGRNEHQNHVRVPG